MIGATQDNQIKLGNGKGVTVGVLDGWANYNLREFGGRLSDSWLFPDGTYNHFDDHGTHVSGIIGAGRNGFGMVGIAPGVQISNVAVFDDFDWPVGSTAAGLALVYGDGATVANMSYGPDRRLARLEDLVAISKYSKLVVTKSAGNDNVHLPSQVFSGWLKNLIIVGAVNPDKTISRFSNKPGGGCFLQYAGASCAEADKYKNRFLVAPGWNISSLAAARDGSGHDRYQAMSGTSMAAPMVAGAVALLQSRWAFLKTRPAQTADLLFATAEDLGMRGVDNVYGRGLLRIDRAMRAYGQTSFAVGRTVNGPSFSTASGGLGLSSAFGTGAGVVNALNGIVVFDSFGRDFNVDPHTVVGTNSTALSLSRQADNRFDMSQRGALVSLQMADGLAFTGVLPEAGNETSEFAGASNALPAYLGDMNDERNVWRLDGNFNSLSFSFGQRTGMVRDVTMGGAENLFLLNSEVSSQPLMALGEQTLFGFGRYKISDSFGVGMGFAETNVETGPEKASGAGRALLMQADYALTEDLGLQFSQTFLTEEDTILGSFSGGALAFGSGAKSLASGGAVSYNFLPNTTARFNFTTATTDSNPSAVSLFRNVGTIESRSYGMSLSHKGVLGLFDEIGLSINKPLRINAGEATVDTPVGRTVEGDVIYKRRTVSLAPEGSETDFDLGYRAALTPGLGLGVNFFYQNELNHDPNQSNAGVYSRMQLVF